MRSKLSTEQRIVAIASAALAALVVVTWLAYFLLGHAFAEAIVAGDKPFGYLRGNVMRLLGGVAPEDQADTVHRLVGTYLGRLTTVYAFCQALLSWGSLRYPRLFTDFFTATTHPLNLAIFRICFFATLLPRPSLNKTLHLIAMPKESRVALPGLAWFADNLPTSPQLHVVLYWMFVVACVMGMLGLATRYACIVATVLTFYLLGITQLFGKIEHQHHLVWVGALLAASRCADVLSVDAWFRKDQSPWLDRPLSRAYALPLRFVWLFLGLIYFFPGLWKYVISGPQWFLSDNLQSRMLLQQFVRDDWEPLFRMDQYPLLCKLGGLGTIVLEIGFVLLVFFPVWRYVAAAGMLSFHWMVKLFLGISFWPIQVFYITFLDWHRGVMWLLGRRPEKHAQSDSLATDSLSTRAVTCVAMIVLAVNTCSGFALMDSWPFGVYPTFARVIGPTFQSLSFTAVDADGKELVDVEAFFDATVRANYGVGIGRLGGILEQLTRVHPDRAERLRTIWSQWHEHHPEVTGVAEVHFYMVEYATNSDDSNEPMGRSLLETVTLEP